ncbi:MAG: hypothetical protein ACI945_001471, partial [Pseudohongiellaceae bacterium]
PRLAEYPAIYRVYLARRRQLEYEILPLLSALYY